MPPSPDPLLSLLESRHAAISAAILATDVPLLQNHLFFRLEELDSMIDPAPTGRADLGKRVSDRLKALDRQFPPNPGLQTRRAEVAALDLVLRISKDPGGTLHGYSSFTLIADQPPSELDRIRELSDTEKRVLVALTILVPADERQALSYVQIAAHAGCRPFGVSLATSELLSAGLIKRTEDSDEAGTGLGRPYSVPAETRAALEKM
ncbi:MAG TPA: hypothetical protein PKW90_10120 [Myxococcota bacterium]|nr:hypothetical protein [Myxococcota bacterium]